MKGMTSAKRLMLYHGTPLIHQDAEALNALESWMKKPIPMRSNVKYTPSGFASQEGRVVQFGKTSSIYRKPATLESAEVFSDPPINTASITKLGDKANLGKDVSWTVPEKLASLPDGAYKIGLRPHHLLPERKGVEVSGIVQIAEISGSESIIRVNVNNNIWVSQTHGIHSYEYGEKASFFFNPDHCMYFGDDDKLIEF